MILNMGGYDNPLSRLPDFTYTGAYQLIDEGKNGNTQNWLIKFLTSGKLIPKRGMKAIDVCCVGGGGGGGLFGDEHTPGSGGAGGYVVNKFGIGVSGNTEYQIIVGDGGSAATHYSDRYGKAGGTTSAFGVTATGGGGGHPLWNTELTCIGGSGGGGLNGNGGTNGGNGSGNKAGSGQGTTTREFGTGTLYSGGGGGGNTGYGGEGGGGNAAGITGTATPGTINTGGGGGGARAEEGRLKEGANGGSGIVVIRNAR